MIIKDAGSEGYQSNTQIEKAYNSGYDIFREFVAELPNDEWVNLITTLDEYAI
jgi:hypothetical protein